MAAESPGAAPAHLRAEVIRCLKLHHDLLELLVILAELLNGEAVIHLGWSGINGRCRGCIQEIGVSRHI